MLVSEVVGVEPGVEYLVTNRLNQDPLENLFCNTRKRWPEWQPRPPTIPLPVKISLIDKILMTSPSSNCKDDLDNFLVNLTQNQKASGIVITPDIDNEPKQIVNLVKTCNMNDFVHLENAIAYVSGYILKRLYETVCRECNVKLEHPSSGERLCNSH